MPPPINNKCIVCGKPVSKDGYKVSWEIEALYFGEEEDERYFCCIDCVRRWINHLWENGFEESIYLDEQTYPKHNY